MKVKCFTAQGIQFVPLWQSFKMHQFHNNIQS